MAPKGCGLITAYFADTSSQALATASDDAIVAEVLAFFYEFMPELE